MMIEGHQAMNRDKFAGFNEARRLMRSHELHARAFTRLEETSFIGDLRIAAVHVDNSTRTNRLFLTAYDHHGQQVATDTLYVDDPTQRLEVASKFDHTATRMRVPLMSDLSESIDRANGWVLDMAEMRRYCILGDRQTTQRAALMAHLPDLMSDGQVRRFDIGGSIHERDSDSDAA